MITWRLHIERTAAKAVATYQNLLSIQKSEFLDFNMKFNLYNALINSIDFYACSEAAYTKTYLSSRLEGVPQKQDRNCQTIINIWS
jgi:hypothetical protein